MEWGPGTVALFPGFLANQSHPGPVHLQLAAVSMAPAVDCSYSYQGLNLM